MDNEDLQRANKSKWVVSLSPAGTMKWRKTFRAECGLHSNTRTDNQQKRKLQMPVRESKELEVNYGRKTTFATCQPSKCLGKSSSPLTCGQSSPSSGVISVSLCTTTLVTDMSGCCSLASLIAWASAYPKETTEGQKQKGGGTCVISSKVERFMRYYTIYKWGKWLKYEIYHHWFNY